jgi:TM2 domain-containing membrane protein YozV
MQQDHHNLTTEEPTTTTTTILPFETHVIQPITQIYDREVWIEPEERRKIHPIVAALLSIPFPGSGQFINHQTTKAASMCISCHILFFLTTLLSAALLGLVLLPLLIILWTCIVMDAYRIASELKQGHAVMKSQCSNNVVVIPMKLLFSKGPIFNENVESEWPVEYTSRKENSLSQS